MPDPEGVDYRCISGRISRMRGWANCGEKTATLQNVDVLIPVRALREAVDAAPAELSATEFVSEVEKLATALVDRGLLPVAEELH